MPSAPLHTLPEEPPRKRALLGPYPRSNWLMHSNEKPRTFAQAQSSAASSEESNESSQSFESSLLATHGPALPSDDEADSAESKPVGVPDVSPDGSHEAFDASAAASDLASRLQATSISSEEAASDLVRLLETAPPESTLRAACLESAPARYLHSLVIAICNAQRVPRKHAIAALVRLTSSHLPGSNEVVPHELSVALSAIVQSSEEGLIKGIISDMCGRELSAESGSFVARVFKESTSESVWIHVLAALASRRQTLSDGHAAMVETLAFTLSTSSAQNGPLAQEAREAAEGLVRAACESTVPRGRSTRLARAIMQLVKHCNDTCRTRQEELLKQAEATSASLRRSIKAALK